MVALLRALGVDYVLDTNFAADLTIVEEASELIRRITEKDRPLPQFTSCCPGWVHFTEIYAPELLPHLSTAKSPIGMQGPTVKTYFAKQMGLDPRQIVHVTLTPCTAKKFEVRREEMHAAGDYHGIQGMRDTDQVITTRELARWAKAAGIDWTALEDSAYDSLMGKASGAGVIFGNTGGVMEAALRTAYAYLTGQSAPESLLQLDPVRGYDGVREAQVIIGDLTLQVAVVYGTANARRFLEHMKGSGKQYHFVEVMACPGGCIGGGGQPKDLMKNADETRKSRIAALYQWDGSMTLRSSHENPEIKAVYEAFYGQPLSELAEQMLHTTYYDRSDIRKRKDEKPMNKWKCKICGYIYEGETLPEDFTCPLCKQPASSFEKLEQAPAKSGSKYAGTQTEKNLEAAFAGESQARNKYTYFSTVAQQEGYEQIAALFRQTAETRWPTPSCGSRSWAAWETPPTICSTPPRVKTTSGRTCMTALPRPPRRRVSPSWPPNSVWSLPLRSATRSATAPCCAMWRPPRSLKRARSRFGECRNCGHIVVGTAAPEVCPTCRYSQSFFEIHCENY